MELEVLIMCKRELKNNKSRSNKSMNKHTILKII